jgi:alpha-amylase
LYLKIVWNTSNTQAVIDEVQLSGTSAATLSATLNSSGYATFCSEYPLDFTDYETADYSAWQLTGVSGETITFSQITGTVKGGTGILLKGTGGADVTLTSTASSTTLDDNLLVGTLAPTYVASGDYYGLSGNEFMRVNAGTVDAGKALLPASAVGGDEVKNFVFVFEEDATGIEETLSNSHLKGENIYNLAGQMVNGKSVNGKLPKGIYIVNGKKVMVK